MRERTVPAVSTIRTSRLRSRTMYRKGRRTVEFSCAGLGLGCRSPPTNSPVSARPVCNDAVTAEISRRHNDVNVLCLAGDLLGQRSIDRLIEIWLGTAFEGGRHARRLQKIQRLERNGDPGPRLRPGMGRTGEPLSSRQEPVCWVSRSGPASGQFGDRNGHVEPRAAIWLPMAPFPRPLSCRIVDCW